MKKENGKGPDMLRLVENPDILKGLGHHSKRPGLLVGFAAETEEIEKHGAAKLERKRADWILANHSKAIHLKATRERYCSSKIRLSAIILQLLTFMYVFPAKAPAA